MKTCMLTFHVIFWKIFVEYLFFTPNWLIPINFSSVQKNMSYVAPHLRSGANKLKLSVPAFSRKFEKKVQSSGTRVVPEEAGPLVFDRDKMCTFPIYSLRRRNLFKVEGYWQMNDLDYKAEIEKASKQLLEIESKFSGPDVDDYYKSVIEQYRDVYNHYVAESKLPIAKNYTNAGPWCGEGDFMFQLQQLQGSKAVECLHADGYSESRLVPNKLAGNVEYRLKIPKEDGVIDYYAWPCGFLNHYVSEFHIKPTKEFHHLVGLLTARE